jgi:phage tail sheath protein FI
MSEFLHGTQVLEAASGSQPITSINSSVIGLVGTAPDADAAKFPLNTPVLINGSRLEASFLDPTNIGGGTLAQALDDILDQGGVRVIVVRVDAAADNAEELANVIGGTTAGVYTGLHALLAAESVVGLRPRVLGATGFSHEAAVAAELGVLAAALGGIGYVDGDNTTDAAAISYQTVIANPRLYLIDPACRVFDTATASNVDRPASARFMGVRAVTDQELGFWESISNRPINGIIGTSRPIGFVNGDFNSQANTLNENNVSTIINLNGFRTWGNRLTDGSFESTRRIKDVINDSVQDSMLWAQDRSIGSTLVEDVVDSVQAFLDTLVVGGALFGAFCWADPDLNTAENIVAGKVYINFDFTATTPAEHIIFTSIATNQYAIEFLKTV